MGNASPYNGGTSNGYTALGPDCSDTYTPWFMLPRHAPPRSAIQAVTPLLTVFINNLMSPVTWQFQNGTFLLGSPTSSIPQLTCLVVVPLPSGIQTNGCHLNWIPLPSRLLLLLAQRGFSPAKPNRTECCLSGMQHKEYLHRSAGSRSINLRRWVPLDEVALFLVWPLYSLREPGTTKTQRSSSA